MRVGVSLTTALATPDARLGARMIVERAAAARRAGLDSLFLGDHHSTGSPYYQNVPIRTCRCSAACSPASPRSDAR